MTFVQRTMFCLVALGSTFGCTTNVEDPVLNQTGRTGDTTCVNTCSEKTTTCKAKCTDDSCKASCETEHSTCVSSCPPAKDGG
jgi:hypothetical protein